MTSEINGEVVVVEETPPPALPPTTLFRTDDPVEVVVAATKVADALSPIIRDRKLFTTIGNKEHVRVEGWTLLGSMLGVFPVAVSSQQLDGGGYECRVEARTLQGHIVGAAISSCTRDERRWKTADDYAIQSMAQTRATSKALRLPLGFVMQLAGYSPTPAEEMEGIHDNKHEGIDNAAEEMENPISGETKKLFTAGREERLNLRDFAKACGLSPLTKATAVARVQSYIDAVEAESKRHPDSIRTQIWESAIEARDARFMAENLKEVEANGELPSREVNEDA
jgi:hypothetical protein